MNSALRIPLKTSPRQHEQLVQLQRAFAEVCNALAPLVQQTRCWNRVALHHMAYKRLREGFPGLGSQMVCNAIYSVSRASRQIFQHPQSHFNIARLGARPLPRLHFLPQAPVYFDRHTLSIKSGQVSMYTMDGRIRFELGLAPDAELRFRKERLREIVLTSDRSGFHLTFHFALPEDGKEAPAGTITAAGGAELPEYLLVHEDPPPAGVPAAAAAVPAQQA
jgi:hypothetical protein